MWESEYPNRNWDFVLEISIKFMLNARTPVSAERTEWIEVKGEPVYEQKKELKIPFGNNWNKPGTLISI